MKRFYPWQVRTLTWIIFGAGFLVAGAGVSQEWVLLSGLGVAIMIGGLVFHLLFYRCPHCGKFLDRSCGEFCPYCGKPVNPQPPQDP